ncbi:MAG TPA: EamA family transporter [Flavipsychrobacter sp.]|nr:EamA family transporter [Flavipsychrobacter sp.]
MLYLIVTILLNTIISAIFKIFPKYNIDNLQAIVANYFACVVIGSLFMGHFPIDHISITQAWFPWSLLMGVGFISVFNMFAYCTKVDGITTSTIANKLSLVIPVIFSIFLYSEHAGAIKIAGILLAFPAVYLTSRVKGTDNKAQSLLWPTLLFIGSGLLDTLTKYSEHNFLPTQDVQATFTVHVFASAALIGVIVVTTLVATNRIKLHWRNIIAGICLAIPNFFSIYYFIRMLNSDFLQSSAAIPVNNIGILVASSLMAIFFFREKVTSYRVIGLLLSVVSILLIAFADIHGRGL